MKRRFSASSFRLGGGARTNRVRLRDESLRLVEQTMARRGPARASSRFLN
jgi:hypothetical protein